MERVRKIPLCSQVQRGHSLSPLHFPVPLAVEPAMRRALSAEAHKKPAKFPATPLPYVHSAAKPAPAVAFAK